jgi:formylglycine-generating enzyme required for sulfatase activity
MRPRLLLVVLLHALGLASCGKDERSKGAPVAATSAVPAWALVSKDQIAEAERLNVPVAFKNAIGMRFVLIPAGTFLMGSPSGEESREETETLHEVTLSKAYYLQTTEVTNGQYRRFRPDHHSGDVEGRSLDGEEQPVVFVSWEDALAFTRWLSDEAPGVAYRLPTEAEWERACRAGTSTAFWWGSSVSTERANFAAWPKRGVTVPVGTLPASPWGLHDMHGNASEWCADRYDDRDYPPGPARDPAGPEEGDSRVRRGGAYDGETAPMLRAAFRIGVGGGEARAYVGFRVAASISGK